MDEQMRLGSSIFLNGPSILPADISLSKCCCSSLGYLNADFKFLWILPCLGPCLSAFQMKTLAKPVKTSCTNTWLGLLCSSSSSLSGLTGVHCGTSHISCWSWSSITVCCWMARSCTFATFMWASALGSGALTLVVVKTDMKIILLLIAYLFPGRVLPMQLSGPQLVVNLVPRCEQICCNLTLEMLIIYIDLAKWKFPSLLIYEV